MVERKLYTTYYAGLGQSEGMSGGDNILIELSRRWKKSLDITILTGEEGYDVCERQGLIGEVRFEVCPSYFKRFRYGERLFWSLYTAFKFTDDTALVYTSSDFWHDLLFGLIVKHRFPTVRWIAGVYLFAPHPLSRITPYKGWKRIRGLGYWLMQRINSLFIKKYADIVFVTSEPDRKYFPGKKVVVVKGGVNIPKLTNETKQWDAVFMGRLHPQKGIKELVEIWDMVTNVLPEAKLLILGDGEERHLIKPEWSWQTFADNHSKDYFFRRCKIILHPAIYESGGMSAAEGMAYGLPAVGFNLPVYETYYPQGFLKAGNKKAFASLIVELLTNQRLYDRTSKNARDLIVEEWDWDKRAESILKEVL